jgi:hypothetical protein
VIGVLFKAFFLFIAGTIAFGLLVGLMALIFGGIGIWPIKNFLLDGFWQNAFAWGTLFLFLAVPIVCIDHLAYPQNDESKITKQLSGLDFWRLVDVGVDISVAFRSKYGK